MGLKGCFKLATTTPTTDVVIKNYEALVSWKGVREIKLRQETRVVANGLYTSVESFSRDCAGKAHANGRNKSQHFCVLLGGLWPIMLRPFAWS